MADSILTRARPLLVARLAGAALTLAVPMVLARVLVPASYGTFKQAWLLSQTLALVLPMGMTQSLYYFVPRERERRDRYVAQTLWVHLGLGLVAAAVLLRAGPLVQHHFGNPELTRNLPWAALFTGLFVAGQPLDVALNATGRIGPAAVVRMLTEAGRGLAMVVGALVTGSIVGVFAGIAVATGVRAIFAWGLLGARHGLAMDRARLRDQFAYALPFGVAFLAIVPQQQFHMYAVGAAVPAAAFAIYSVGTFQLPIVDILYTPVSELLQIGMAEAQGARRGARAELALFHEAVLQLSFAFLPVMGLLLVVAPDLIGLLFSDRYGAAAPIFRLSVLSVALAALPLDGVMRARAQNRFMLGLSVAKLSVTVPLVLGGLAAFGPIGALGGWIAAEAIARAAMLARTARLFETSLAGVLPARPIVRQLVATAVAMPPAWLALHAPGAARPLRLAAACLAFGAAYLGLSWVRGWLPTGWVALFARRRPGAAAAPSEP